jgi:hypothetical protein
VLQREALRRKIAFEKKNPEKIGIFFFISCAKVISSIASASLSKKNASISLLSPVEIWHFVWFALSLYANSRTIT